ncbi:hypothetical protein Hdeb2414_s0013g00415391 [Helianthus debilis subsp. tardiflorus]
MTAIRGNKSLGFDNRCSGGPSDGGALTEYELGFRRQPSAIAMVSQVVRISAFSSVLSFYMTTVSDSSCYGLGRAIGQDEVHVSICLLEKALQR